MKTEMGRNIKRDNEGAFAQLDASVHFELPGASERRSWPGIAQAWRLSARETALVLRCAKVGALSVSRGSSKSRNSEGVEQLPLKGNDMKRIGRIEADAELLIGEMSTGNIEAARQLVHGFAKGNQVAIAKLLVSADVEGVGKFQRACVRLEALMPIEGELLDERVLLRLFMDLDLKLRG